VRNPVTFKEITILDRSKWQAPQFSEREYIGQLGEEVNQLRDFPMTVSTLGGVCDKPKILLSFAPFYTLQTVSRADSLFNNYPALFPE
jgi:hypothetical protein